MFSLVTAHLLRPMGSWVCEGGIQLDLTFCTYPYLGNDLYDWAAWQASGLPTDPGSAQQRTRRADCSSGSVLDTSWWRWRESNPRPKLAWVGVYKLSVAI